MVCACSNTAACDATLTPGAKLTNIMSWRCKVLTPHLQTWMRVTYAVLADMLQHFKWFRFRLQVAAPHSESAMICRNLDACQDEALLLTEQSASRRWIATAAISMALFQSIDAPADPITGRMSPGNHAIFQSPCTSTSHEQQQAPLCPKADRHINRCKDLYGLEMSVGHAAYIVKQGKGCCQACPASAQSQHTQTPHKMTTAVAAAARTQQTHTALHLE